MKKKRTVDQVITKLYCSRANVDAILDRKITDAEWKHCKKHLLEYEFTYDDGETSPLEDVVQAWEEEYNNLVYHTEVTVEITVDTQGIAAAKKAAKKKFAACDYAGKTTVLGVVKRGDICYVTLRHRFNICLTEDSIDTMNEEVPAQGFTILDIETVKNSTRR